MGTKHIGLGSVLFSKTQRKILSLLLGHPNKSYYTNEIVRLVDMGVGSVQRELEKLTLVGILTVMVIGNQKHYQANPQSPIFTELRSIILKTFGLADIIRRFLETFSEQVIVAFIFGSIAKGTDNSNSDIDVMLIAENLSYSDVMLALVDTEATLGRMVNPQIYQPETFKSKLANGNAFLHRIVKQPKIFLIGSYNDIPTP